MPHHVSLLQKLGYQAGEAVDTVDAPEWFLEYLRGNGVHTHAKLPTEWLHLFMTDAYRLDHFLQHLKFNEIQKGIWVSWPAKESGLTTNITEQNIRNLMTPYGWVTTARGSIDDNWNGIKCIKQK